MFIRFDHPCPVNNLPIKYNIQTTNSYNVIEALTIRTLNGEINGVVEVYTDMDYALFYKLDKDKLNVIKKSYAEVSVDKQLNVSVDLNNQHNAITKVLLDIIKQPQQSQLQCLIHPKPGISMETQIQKIRRTMKKIFEKKGETLNNVLVCDCHLMPGVKEITGVSYGRNNQLDLSFSKLHQHHNFAYQQN